MLSPEASLLCLSSLALIRFLHAERKTRKGPLVTVIGDIECSVITHKLDEIPVWGNQEIVSEPPTVQGGGSCLNTAAWLCDLFNNKCIVTVPKIYSSESLWENIIGETTHRHGMKIVKSDSVSEETRLGTCLYLCGPRGKSAVKFPGTNSHFKLTEFDFHQLVPEKTQHVHFAGYFNCPGIWGDDTVSFIRACRQINVRTISLNPQFVPDWDKDIMRILALVDFFICNQREAESITEKTDLIEATRALSQFCNCVVVTLGEEGALLMRKCIDLRPLRVVCRETTQLPFEDTVGAGSAFCAGLISEIVTKNLKSESPQLVDAVRFACACGTASCTVIGGSTFPGISTIRECLID